VTVRRLPARNAFDSLRVTIQANTWGIDHHGDGETSSVMDQRRVAGQLDRNGTENARHAVFSAFSPSFLIVCSRITNFWILPVMVIGNSATNST
jgi:hypothetical protein